MLATASLRRDHDLIERVIKAMRTTTGMLRDGRDVPESFLNQVIDFSKNFTDVCHHSKEEESLFPALERAGMPRSMGPIAVMLMEHKKTREIASRMEGSAKAYLQSGDPSGLIRDMDEYITHVTEHLWKENNRLFLMAEMRLQHVSDKVDGQIRSVEKSRLDGLGRDRKYYEDMADEIEDSQV